MIRTYQARPTASARFGGHVVEKGDRLALDTELLPRPNGELTWEVGWDL